jgi:hypothetical protein
MYVLLLAAPRLMGRIRIKRLKRIRNIETALDPNFVPLTRSFAGQGSTPFYKGCSYVQGSGFQEQNPLTFLKLALEKLLDIAVYASSV